MVGISLLFAGGCPPQGGDPLRRNAGMFGKGDEQRLVAGEIVDDAAEKAGRLRGAAKIGRANARQGEETTEILGPFGEEGEGQNGHPFGLFAGSLTSFGG